MRGYPAAVLIGQPGDDSMTTRRDFMVGAGATLAASNLPGCSADNAETAAQNLLAEIAEQLLVDYPENATALGIDNGARAALKSRLSDRSATGQEAIAQRVAKRLTRFAALNST